MAAFEKAKTTVDLGKIQEGNVEVKKENIGTRKLLEGFNFLNVKIHLLTDDLNKLYKKEKYKDIFDVGVLGIGAADKMKEEDHQNIWKKGAKVHVETCDNLVIMKKEQRAEFRKKLDEYATGAGWKDCKEHPYDAHMLWDTGK